MRIEGTNNLTPKGLGDSQIPARTPVAPDAKAEVFARDAAVTAAQQKYVPAALAGDDIDEAAVAEAKKLLESGQLDTPAAALRAADAMLKFGI
jgi:hypothetical protein